MIEAIVPIGTRISVTYQGSRLSNQGLPLDTKKIMKQNEMMCTQVIKIHGIIISKRTPMTAALQVGAEG